MCSGDKGDNGRFRFVFGSTTSIQKALVDSRDRKQQFTIGAIQGSESGISHLRDGHDIDWSFLRPVGPAYVLRRFDGSQERSSAAAAA